MGYWYFVGLGAYLASWFVCSLKRPYQGFDDGAVTGCLWAAGLCVWAAVLYVAMFVVWPALGR